MVFNIRERRKWIGSSVQYSCREGADRAVASNILVGREWTGDDV